jgi:hypothetical protein
MTRSCPANVNPNFAAKASNPGRRSLMLGSAACLALRCCQRVHRHSAPSGWSAARRPEAAPTYLAA